MRYVLLIAGFLVVGLIAVSLIKAFLGFFFYVLVGVLVVGGGLYLYRQARSALTGRGPFRLRK